MNALLIAGGVTSALLLCGCSATTEQPPATDKTSLPLSASAAVTATVPRDPEQDPKLIAAARTGNVSGVQRALTRGASVKATDDSGQTALIAAAYGNHLDVAEVLIANGADVNTKDETVQSAYLISTAEVGDDPRLLRLTLRNGARINAKDSFNGTGLIRAADRGYPRVVRHLINSGIVIDHVNRLGWTALHEAIILGDGSQPYVEVVRLLVAAGADVNLPSANDGVRPLRHAQTEGHNEIAQILSQAGAY